METGQLVYKCPCCNAGLKFSENQKMTCEYCGNEFKPDAVLAFNQQEQAAPEAQWEEHRHTDWTAEDEETVRTFTCPSCGGELMSDENTAATFCPYCENPTIISGRLSGGIRPDAVIPFKTSREDAKTSFLAMCKNKPLLPKGFADEQRLEKISSVYVPFWLYDCEGDFNGRYRATRVHHWSDSHYHYTRTQHFLLTRAADASFSCIPMDASSKMDNTIMESIEPFDYSQLSDFDTAYLSGHLADKYDVEAQVGYSRIQQRVDSSMDEMIAPTILGYATSVPIGKYTQVRHGKCRYVLLPVWMLHSQYKGKIYTFAMNGQTGKITGNLPICPKRTAAWFAGIFAGVTAIAAVLLSLLILG